MPTLAPPAPPALADASSDAPALASRPTLASLAPGREAAIERVDTSTAVGRRLLDLGFAPGTRVRVVRRAPMGDPVAYELRGYRICLRRAEAALVQVSATAGAPGARGNGAG